MEERNKKDNLERFFEQSLKNYEEDPGEDFWARIEPKIPVKPVDGKAPFYKGWMLIAAFLLGILSSAIFFNWQFNNLLIANLEQEISTQKNTILSLESEKKVLQNIISSKNQDLLIANTTIQNRELLEAKKSPEILVPSVNPPKKSIAPKSAQNKSFIKPDVARTEKEVAATSPTEVSPLQPLLSIFSTWDSPFIRSNPNQFFSYQFGGLVSDYQSVVTNVDNQKSEETPIDVDAPLNHQRIGIIDPVLSDKKFRIQFIKDYRPINWAAVKFKTPTNKKLWNADDDDGMTSFIIASLNPISALKYKLDGYNPNVTISEVAGIKSSWSWSFTGGFETKTNWSFQIGFDYNKLVLVKESINNIRFKSNEAQAVNGGYLFSFNQQSDGALGPVVVNSSVNNQIWNDGADVLHGDLFKLTVNTLQPLRIVRMPIMGGYKFKLNERWHITPKIGLAAVWSIKEQTKLGYVRTLNERLSLQSSSIFLTNKITKESLEGVLRAEIGYHWRKKWYLVAEPRFKYSAEPLFTYKAIELKDAPFQLLLGLRFNID